MTPEDQTELPQPLPPSTSAQDSRRRLLRGGLAAAPVLLTLTSRPVMAVPCSAPSAAVSLSSRTTSTRVECVNGKTPAAWKTTAKKDWPGGAAAAWGKGANGTLFNSVFSTGYADKSLLDVLELTPMNPTDTLAQHLVAAYLNAVAGLTPSGVLDVLRTKQIWTDFTRVGYFQPNAGINWGAAELTAWLQTTMPKIS